MLQGEWWKTLGVWIAKLLASPMMLAWETLLVQAQANRVTAEAQRDVAQAQREVAQDTFRSWRTNYHPIAAKMLAQALKLPN